MQIKLAEISNIKPYENNPRKLSEQAIEKVAMSLKEYGFRQPIVVDKNMVIVAGHTRYRASKKLGFKADIRGRCSVWARCRRRSKLQII